MNIENPKFCINCIHHIKDSEGKMHYAKCDKIPNDDNGVISEWLVKGGDKPIQYYFCSTHRQSTCDDKCGVDAKFFEPLPEINK